MDAINPPLPPLSGGERESIPLSGGKRESIHLSGWQWWDILTSSAPTYKGGRGEDVLTTSAHTYKGGRREEYYSSPLIMGRER